MSRTTIPVSLICLLLTGASCRSSKADPLIELRNNWYSYISIERPEFRFSSSGVANAFEVPIQNNTDYFLDQVVVAVKYLGLAGGVSSTEQVTVYNIPPHSVKKGRVPERPNGAALNFEIRNIISTTMKFIYPGSRSNATDPYLYY